MTWLITRLLAEAGAFFSSANLLPFLGIAIAVWAVAWVAGVGTVWWAGYRMTSPALVALAAPTGLVVTAALWSALVSLGVPPTTVWLLVVPLALALVGWRQRRATSAAETPDRPWIAWAPAGLVWLIAFAVLANLLRSNVVFPGYDSQSTTYFAWLFEREHAYPLVHPFLNATRMLINYPLAFDIVYVLLHQWLPWPLETMQMGAFIATATLFSVAVAGLVFSLTGSPSWAVLGGMASLARGFTFQIIASNATETFAMVAMAVALGWLALGVTDWKWRTAVLVGVGSAAAILSNGKVFQLYAVTLILAGLWWLAAHPGRRRPVFVWLATATLACAVPVLPWAWRALAGLGLIGLGQHPIVHPWRNVTRWNEPLLLALALAGAVIAVIRGPRLARVLAGHGLACLAIAQYWVLLRLWSPPWFEIVKIPFDEWLGTDRLFVTPFPYPYTNEVGFIGYTIALPVLAAYLGHVASGWAGRLGRWARVACLVVGALLALAATRSMLPGEPLGYQLLTTADYHALKWVARSTPRATTLLLNPWHMSPAPEGNWAAVVADRPTVFFRADDSFIRWLGPPLGGEAMKAAYQGPGAPTSLPLLRASGVTHVFVPARLSPALTDAYERARGFEKVVEASAPGGQRAAIFAVK